MRWDWYKHEWLVDGVFRANFSGCQTKHLGHVALFTRPTTTTTTTMPIAMEMLLIVGSIEETRISKSKTMLYQTAVDAPLITYQNEAFVATIGRTTSLAGVHTKFEFPATLQNAAGFMWMFSEWSFNLFNSLDNIGSGFLRLVSITAFTPYGSDLDIADTPVEVFLGVTLPANPHCLRWDWQTFEWTRVGLNVTDRGCQSAQLGYIGLFDLPPTTTSTTMTRTTTTSTLTPAPNKTNTSDSNTANEARKAVANGALRLALNGVVSSIFFFCVKFHA